MRLLICAGGTGGGVYPALTVLQELVNEAEAVLWVGGEGGMEAELVQRKQIPFTAIPAAGVHGVGIRTLPGNLLQLTRGTLAARRILKDFRPDVLLFTGGYVAVPVAVAGMGIPSVLYVPDIEPGLAIQALARFADTIAVTTDTCRQHYSSRKHVVITGYPTRPELRSWTRESGRAALNLDAEKPVLLVFGGSKGARSINRALLSILPQALEHAQIVHISGKLDWEEVELAQSNLPDPLKTQYHAFPYLHEEMGAALAAADLAVSRAGASSLGEYPLVGLPAILIPYPYAWRYQKTNAQYLVEHGAARLIRDEMLAQELLPALKDFFANPEKLNTMHNAMQSLATPDAAGQIANLVRALAAKRKEAHS